MVCPYSTVSVTVAFSDISGPGSITGGEVSVTTEASNAKDKLGTTAETSTTEVGGGVSLAATWLWQLNLALCVTIIIIGGF